MSTATCPASPATSTIEAAASRRLAAAEASLRRWDTPLESALLAVVDRRLTDRVATVAVRLRRDGVAQLLANPTFVVDLDADDVAFVLCHEALHLLFNHLRVNDGDDAAWRLACEVVINQLVQCHTGRPLPRSTATGQPVGIDPAVVHADYARQVTDPVDYATFVRTDAGCAEQLRRLAGPVPTAGCRHLDGNEADTCDQPAVEAGPDADAVVDTVLERLIQRAVDGDDRLRGQLLAVKDTTDRSPVWARVGGEELRATSTRLAASGLWQRQLAHVLGSQLSDQLEPAYDRKTGWWDTALLAPLGIDLDPEVGMPLVLATPPCGHRQVAVFIDTSGSVPDAVVAAVADTVGEVAETSIDWHTFDTEVHPFAPGEPLVGGGGTDFAVIVDHLAAVYGTDTDNFPDAVVVVTDGHASPIAPPHAGRWIWLIVNDGDPWPRTHGMRTVTVPELGQEH